MITFTSNDGHTLPVYRAGTDATIKGNIILLQEIFGVTTFMRELADHYAAAGFQVFVPALFSRQINELSIAYADMERGRGCAMACNHGEVMADIAAVADNTGNALGTAVIGFCWGGTQAYLSACELPIQAAVAYYGTAIHNHLDKTPQCPVQLHFGGQDALVPTPEVTRIQQHLPDQEIYVYEEAGHAFANSERAALYHSASALLAEQRTLDFLATHLPAQ